MYSTLICAPSLLHANLSTFHTIFEIYHHISKIYEFEGKTKKPAVAIRVYKKNYNFLLYGFDPR